MKLLSGWGSLRIRRDVSGKVLAKKAVTATEAELTGVIYSFSGDYYQLPPMYSAIKINGKRLYESARAGQEVERPARRVEIKGIDILSLDLPEARIRVRCSKGTYIRTLCHDIGEKLGCGAVMTYLKRIRSGDFTVEDAYTLDQLAGLAAEDRIQEVIRDIDTMFLHLPMIAVPEEQHSLLQNGNRIPVRRLIWPAQDGMAEADAEAEVRVYSHDGQFYGIYRYEKAHKSFRPVKMFLC